MVYWISISFAALIFGDDLIDRVIVNPEESFKSTLKTSEGDFEVFLQFFEEDKRPSIRVSVRRPQ